MPKRENLPVGAPIWFELATSDPDRAEAFYAAVFGWAAQHTGEEFGNYVNFAKGDELIAGMMRQQQPGAPDSWLVYLHSADAKATVDAARAAGGHVVVEPMDVGDIGTMAVLVDPSGAAVGIWEPGTHRGSGLVAEAGAPSWFELHTRDYAASVAFYERVFGWTTSVMSDTDEFRYTLLVDSDGEQYAGVMDAAGFLEPGTNSVWRIYLGADDVDATLAQVEQLGGRIDMPAEDTPFGRLAQAADPTGAVFKLSSLELPT